MAAPLAPPPVAPQVSPRTLWWATTVAGVVVIPGLLYAATAVPEPFGAMLVGIAGAVGTALGLANPGALRWTPPPR